jgi:hypothetical protein
MEEEPARLVDYVLVVSHATPIKPIPGQSTKDLFSLAWETEVCDRFPLEDHPDFILPPGLAMFCMPEGFRLTGVPPLPKFHAFASTIGNGDRVYGYCLQFFEPASKDLVRAASMLAVSFCGKGSSELEVSESEGSVFQFNFRPSSHAFSETEQEEYEHSKQLESSRSTSSAFLSTMTLSSVTDPEVYAPKSLVILSRWMFLDQFREFLNQLYRISLSPSETPVERYLGNLLFEVPVPPPGISEVHYRIATSRVVFTRPPVNNPIAFTNFPFIIIFQCIGLELIVKLVEALLLEKQVLLLSTQYSLLTIACESLLALMYPFKWQHVYIPLLPEPLLDFLSAPMPFLIGTLKPYIQDMKTISKNIVIVDLDSGKLLSSVSGIPDLPSRQRRKLFAEMKTLEDWVRQSKVSGRAKIKNFDLAFSYASTPEETAHDFAEEDPPMSISDIRHSFLKPFISILRNYKSFLLNYSRKDDGNPLFNISGFLLEFPAGASEFLTPFLSTQLFDRFCEDRISGKGDVVEILFLDEMIIAKKNRSIFSRREIATPFLHDESSEVKEVYEVPPPDKSNLPASMLFASSR